MAIYVDSYGDKFEADDLKNCPCCGGRATLTFRPGLGYKKNKLVIKCEQCGLQINKKSKLDQESPLIDKSIAKWNKRPENICQPQVHESMLPSR